jgi:hypothetical protein
VGGVPVAMPTLWQAMSAVGPGSGDRAGLPQLKLLLPSLHRQLLALNLSSSADEEAPKVLTLLGKVKKAGPPTPCLTRQAIDR